MKLETCTLFIHEKTTEKASLYTSNSTLKITVFKSWIIINTLYNVCSVPWGVLSVLVREKTILNENTTLSVYESK